MYSSSELSGPDYQIARQLARKLLKTASISTYPVLIKKIVPYIPDLQIDGAELQNDISGIQVSYKGRDYIRYNQRHASTRNRFTLAHEIAHIMLGHTVNEGIFLATKEQDREADCFAAELLMPLTLMKQAITEYRTISDLANIFWVSKTAMTNRVMATGLYKHITSFN